jgi:hypothetical protein
MLASATKIQRAWRKYGGLTANGRGIESDFIVRMRNDEYQLADPGYLAAPQNLAKFRTWLHKLLARCSVPDAAQLALDPGAVSCWFVIAHRARWQENAPDLVERAEELVSNFLDLQEGKFENIRELPVDLNNFLEAFTSWKETDLRQFNQRLRRSMIELVCRAVRQTSESVAFQVRSLTALYKLMDHEAESFHQSVVYISIKLASKSEFWNPSVSQAKLIHELILESNFSVSVDRSIPKLHAKHSVDGHIVDSQLLREDLMSSLMSSFVDAETLERVANIFHSTRDSSSAVFCNAVFGVIKDLTENTSVEEHIRREWDTNKDSRPLDSVVTMVRIVRNLLDNAAIDYVRQNLGRFITNNNIMAATFSILQVRETVRTWEWAASALARCDIGMLAALSDGNPFALLEIFNQSVLELVFKPIDIDFLTTDHLPEFLRYDQERLIDIRLDLATSSTQCELKHLIEFVTARRWIGPSHACTPAVVQAAKRLRGFLDFSRACHGQMICHQFMGTAKLMVESYGLSH